MLRIVSHIEQLLLLHDCVIVPGMGGFVMQLVPASCLRESHYFRPMGREVAFNATLRHDDGLLVEAYRRAYALDFTAARRRVGEDVTALQATLERERRVPLGRLGAFALGEEGQLLFEAAPGEQPALDAYGLEAFYFPALSLEGKADTPAAAPRPPVRQEIRRERLPQRSPQRPATPVRLLRIAGALAAAIALFFLISTPVKEVSPAAYTASFVPSTRVHLSQETPATGEHPAGSVAATPVRPKQDTAVRPAEKAVRPTVKAVPQPKRETVAAVAAPREPATPQAVKRTGKRYHLIIASFPTEAQADRYLKGVDRKVCRAADKVVSGGKYRVYAAAYDERAAAEAALAQLRKQAAYKDAWLFVGHR